MAPSCKWPVIKLKVCEVINWPKYDFSYWNVYQKFRYTVLPLTIYCFFVFPIVGKKRPGSEPWKMYKKMSENLESSRYLTCSESTLSIQQPDAYFN